MDAVIGQNSKVFGLFITTEKSNKVIVIVGTEVVFECVKTSLPKFIPYLMFHFTGVGRMRLHHQLGKGWKSETIDKHNRGI